MKSYKQELEKIIFFKEKYQNLMDKSESISDILYYNSKICELKEEEENLKNKYGVKI